MEEKSKMHTRRGQQPNYSEEEAGFRTITVGGMKKKKEERSVSKRQALQISLGYNDMLH